MFVKQALRLLKLVKRKLASRSVSTCIKHWLNMSILIINYILLGLIILAYLFFSIGLFITLFRDFMTAKELIDPSTHSIKRILYICLGIFLSFMISFTLVPAAYVIFLPVEMMVLGKYAGDKITEK